MTGRDDIVKLLDGWLSEGPTQLSDRALDAALDVVDHTPQRRVLRLPWRTPFGSLWVRMAAVALVAVVAIGGMLILLPRVANFGQTSPSPTSRATPAPTVSSVPSAEPPAPTAPIAGTVLAAGRMPLASGTTYSTLTFAPAFTIRGAGSWWLMGDGPAHAWFGSGPNEPRPPDLYGLGIVVAAKVLPVGGGSAVAAPPDLITWLRGRSDLALGAPQIVTVGGLRGTSVVGTVRSGASTNTGGAINLICSADFPCGQEQGNEIGVGPGRAFEIIVILVDGKTVVIEADGSSRTWSGTAPTIDAFLGGLSFPGVAN